MNPHPPAAVTFLPPAIPQTASFLLVYGCPSSANLGGMANQTGCMSPDPPPSATHRLIHCLYIDLEPTPEKPGSSAIVVWLNRRGNSVRRDGARPRPPTQRLIDLRAGDQLLHNSQWRSVKEMHVYRGHWLTDEQAAEHSPDGDGYLYRLSDRQ